MVLDILWNSLQMWMNVVKVWMTVTKMPPVRTPLMVIIVPAIPVTQATEHCVQVSLYIIAHPLSPLILLQTLMSVAKVLIYAMGMHSAVTQTVATLAPVTMAFMVMD